MHIGARSLKEKRLQACQNTQGSEKLCQHAYEYFMEMQMLQKSFYQQEDHDFRNDPAV